MAHHVDFTIRPRSAGGQTGHDPLDCTKEDGRIRRAGAKKRDDCEWLHIGFLRRRLG